MLDKIKRFASRNKVNYRLIFFMYIIYEKMTRICYLLFRIFPIKQNKIVFCTAGGKRYGDNPMYIFNELVKRNRNYEIVWLLKKGLNPPKVEGIKYIESNFLTEIYTLVTAKVWVDSNWKTSGVLKRKNQFFLETWHGSYGLKKVGVDLGEKLSLIEEKNCEHCSNMFDLVISNSKKTTEIYKRAFRYNGKVFEYGSPRNDIFFKENELIIDKVKNYFKAEGKNIVLYAPTYRNDYRVSDFKLDYIRLLSVLEKRYGGQWILLLRLHPSNRIEAKKIVDYDVNIKNASDYLFMQELLVASDILITDYSSCMFDFVTTGKTCFLYATDVEKYREERDYYFELEDLPFPLAENNGQLEENILNFNEDIYQKKLDELFEQVGLCETGHASEKVADYIEQWMKEN